MNGFSTFTWVAIFAIESAIVNGIGIIAIFKNRKWAEGLKTYSLCFAAGVLISVPLMLAFPQAVEKNFYAGFSALIGFLFMFLGNRLIRYKIQRKDLAFGITAVEGIGIHSFVDGIIYSVTFSASVPTGLLGGTGMVLHEFAEGVITFSLLMTGGIRKERAAFYAFLIAGLSTPVGAFIAYPFVSKLSTPILGLALGFVSGVLIYVSAFHLLPEALEDEKQYSTWVFLAGIALALFIVLAEIV